MENLDFCHNCVIPRSTMGKFRINDALKDCLLVFLAAAFAFLTNYYLVNSRTDQRTITQPRQQAVSPVSFQQPSDRARP